MKNEIIKGAIDKVIKLEASNDKFKNMQKLYIEALYKFDLFDDKIKELLSIVNIEDYYEVDFLDRLLNIEPKLIFDYCSIETLDELYKKTFNLGVTETFSSMIDLIADASCDYTYIDITEEQIPKLIRLIKISYIYDFVSVELLNTLGDYYYEIDPDKAMEIYSYAVKYSCENIIEDDFCYTVKGLVNLYLDHDKVDAAVSTIESAIKKIEDIGPETFDEYTEYINLVYLLIAVLEDNNLKYAEHFDKGLKIGAKGVSILRDNKDEEDYYYYSNTQLEKTYLRIMIYRLGYLLEQKNYKEFNIQFEAAMDEIAQSACTRFYAPLDEIYSRMIEAMTVDYKEFSFFKNLKTIQFPYDVNNLIEDQVIELVRNRQKCSFKVFEHYTSKREDVIVISLIPIYPIIGEGQRLYFKLVKDRIKKIAHYEYATHIADKYVKDVITI